MTHEADKNVIYLGDRTDDCRHVSPEIMLRHALHEYETGGKMARFKKAMIVFLDDEDGRFDVRFRAANMHCSSMLAALRCFETRVLSWMGYVPRP